MDYRTRGGFAKRVKGTGSKGESPRGRGLEREAYA